MMPMVLLQGANLIAMLDAASCHCIEFQPT
jgi:hypothetical protein